MKALLPDDQFQAMCGDVGREAARFLQRRPEEIEQGARQLGDKARGQETPRNPLAFELCNGAGLRSGTPPDMPDEQVTELWQAMEALNAKYGL